MIRRIAIASAQYFFGFFFIDSRSDLDGARCSDVIGVAFVDTTFVFLAIFFL